MQAISDHVGSYQGIAYYGLTKWTNEDLFLSFAYNFKNVTYMYESFATVGEIRVWCRAHFQSGSRVLKKVF